MKLADFNKLDYNKKLFKIVDEATFLENYITSDIRINLYSLYNFYVELVYDGDNNRIEEIRSFESSMYLDKYISNIKIP
ncbi:hypothetical protein [Winogradskyella sp. SYSU M77433]|uniref:hypothetical protein n=1 Tax=Winogradskyella sp. SYSU M77433 TaxID=3042722 RepID=UPI0024803F65|nr:hypothetical protein [Winogradskyella sp. SYSU M77433]MDH7912089.1 hypothetical protein [Winogradskyella sp. SYSU M77433]